MEETMSQNPQNGFLSIVHSPFISLLQITSLKIIFKSFLLFFFLDGNDNPNRRRTKTKTQR
jgi:hypothetical protein